MNRVNSTTMWSHVLAIGLACSASDSRKEPVVLRDAVSIAITDSSTAVESSRPAPAAFDTLPRSLRPNEPPGLVAFAETGGGDVPLPVRRGGGGQGGGGGEAGGQRRQPDSTMEGRREERRTQEAASSTEQRDGYGKWTNYATGMNRRFSLEDDPAAPVSPPRVIKTVFPRGWEAGRGPVSWGGWDERGPRDGQKRRFYFSLWLKVDGRSYEQQPVGTKTIFLGFGRNPERSSGNEGYILLESDRNAVHEMTAFNVHFHQGGHIRPPENRRQNVNHQRLMTVGTWHHWEVYMELNTLGANNGVLRFWIDNQQIMNYTNMVYVTPGNENGFWSWRWNPTWGGTQGVKSRDDDILIDHVYMSGQ